MQPDIENFFVEYCHTSLYNNYMRENFGNRNYILHI